MNCYIVLQDCLMGMLKDKTILYVTHQVEFLPAADLILVSIKNTFLLASTTCMLVLLRICKITKGGTK